MNGQGPTKPADWEAEINALLDGDLDKTTTAALKAAAAEDQALARAIVEAWQLQQCMDGLQLEKAPASLARRLASIPRELAAKSRRRTLGMPRWITAAGLASVALAALLVMLLEPPGQRSSAPQQVASGAGIEAEQARKARRDLAIAFSYLDKAGLRVSRQIQEVLSEELSAPVKDNLSEHIPYLGQSRKEKHA
jgi:hypothetical protein